VKCSECGYEWNALLPDAIIGMECPSCQQKMLISYQQFSSIAEGIRYAMGIYAERNGKNPYELLKNSTAFSNYLKDMLGNSYPNSSLVQLAIKSGVGSILYEAVEKDENAQKVAAMRAVSMMHTEFATEQTKAEEIIGFFTTALGWNLEESSHHHNVTLQETHTQSAAVHVLSPSSSDFSPHTTLQSFQSQSHHATVSSTPHQNSSLPEHSYASPTPSIPPTPSRPTIYIPDEPNNRNSQILPQETSHNFPLWLIPFLLLLLILAVLGFGLLHKKQQESSSTAEYSQSSQTEANVMQVPLSSDSDAPATQQAETTPPPVQETTEPQNAIDDAIPQYIVVNGKYTWEQAESDCEARGGHLAAVHSDAQWDALMKVVQDASRTNSNLRYLWMGATSNIDDDMNLTFSWIDNGESNYILQKENAWYYNQKLGIREPSGYDAYEYQQNGKLVREPYLALWIAQKGDGWTLNDLPDVTNYSQYQSSNMGYIMQLPPDAEIPDVPIQTDAPTVRAELPKTEKQTTPPKKTPTINCSGKVITYENTDYYEYHLTVSGGTYDYYYVECYGYESSLVLSGAETTTDLYLTAGSGFDVITYVTPYFNDGTKGKTTTITSYQMQVLKNEEVFVKPEVYSCYYQGEIYFGSYDTVAGFTTDYVCNGGERSKVRTSLGNHWHVTAQRWCYSRGVTWYELYDTDDGDYYGWVDANYIYFY